MTSPASIAIRSARVLTLDGPPGASRGPSMSDVAAVDNCDVVIRGDVIEAVAPDAAKNIDAATTIDADGRVVMPAFIDAHTHACWAGDRLDEWQARMQGASYLELLERGGGIMSTVRAVREATEAELTDLLVERLDRATAEGTTAIEIKSGYGLDTDTELKMLRAIRAAAERWQGHVSPTACIGHALDPDVDRQTFIDRVVNGTLPAVTEAFPHIAIDAYCEQGAWTVAECERLFTAARDRGHPIRVHADQFNELGMLDAAIDLGALSVDHLEATEPDALRRLAKSDTFGVMLPCSGFHVDRRYADGRSFTDAGGKLVIATNVNPGSAPCYAMPMAIALAARFLGVTVHEAIVACTRNAAALLGLDDRGRVAPGARADLVMLPHRSELELGHTFGARSVSTVIRNGQAITAA